ncbi:hypothetical protein E1B28_000060 [Marasmius oreades]|uniref:Uncharacterized protein n=1 Tax=Marasmius oreades TaxID=181124 RepID=A0A9P7V0M9_9AGAR|nr:uncharacterized protein E1B28_000060 [Marasmius oreades]KAG7098086.1 hypothetical protein E1B28_000060 [Marasmius oreades]
MSNYLDSSSQLDGNNLEAGPSNISARLKDENDITTSDNSVSKEIEKCINNYISDDTSDKGMVNQYGETWRIGSIGSCYNEFVEASLDGINGMIDYTTNYNFEEERQWTEEQWDHFIDPPKEKLDLSDPQLQLSIQFYLILSHASEGMYANMWKVYNLVHPATPLLSYDQVR